MGGIAQRIGTFLVVAMLAAWGDNAPAQEDLRYQARANRWEGIRATPVAGFDIELLSARVDYLDNPESLGERFGVRFFLDKARSVDIVVRERDYRHFYLLNRVDPPSKWRPGFGNVFEWPTADVVRKLGDLRLYHLAVVARLDKSEPSAVETVAPVILYQSQVPKVVSGYVFTFGLRDTAKLAATFYAEPALQSVDMQELGEVTGAGPFDVRWDAAGAPEGRYRLVVSGYSLSTNDKINQVVRFYHRPMVK